MPAIVVLALLGPLACKPVDPLIEIRSLHEAGRYEDSLEPLRELLEDRPDDPEVLYLYGVALTGSTLLTQAVWPLRRAMEHPDWQAAAGLQLASVAITSSDWDMAIDILDPMVERDPQNTQVRVLRAYARAQSRQDYEGALEDADAAIELDPDSSDALVIRAVALLGLERIDDAGEAIETATAHFDRSGLGLAESPRFCVVRATFQKEKKELETAETVFEECLEKYPVNFLVVDEAVKFFDEIGRSDRSLEIIRTAFEGAPGFRSYRLSLVHRLSMNGDDEEAEELMLDATRTEQLELAASAFADLAGFYFVRDRLDDSISAFEEALTRDPDPGSEFLFTYADALVAAERYDQAQALAERMTVVPHRELISGRVWLGKGEPEKALEHFTRGLELWPENAVARYFAATAAEQLGDYTRAIEEYRYSIRADAAATDARLRLAELYKASGDDGSALEVVRHDADRKASGDLRTTLLEVELLARLGRAQDLPARLTTAIQTPEVWPLAMAALAEGVRANRGAAAAARVILTADRLDLSAPINAPALRSLVGDLISIGRAEKALAGVDAALKAHPDSAALNGVRGLVLSRSGADADEVSAAWKRALELDPQEAIALRGLAALAVDAGDPDTALALYRRAAAADPDDTVALRRTAELLEANGQGQEAERALEALLDRDRYDGAAALRLAQLLLERDPAGAEKRIIVLLRGAERFGGGDEATRLLEGLGSGGEKHAAVQRDARIPKHDRS